MKLRKVIKKAKAHLDDAVTFKRPCHFKSMRLNHCGLIIACGENGVQCPIVDLDIIATDWELTVNGVTTK